MPTAFLTFPLLAAAETLFGCPSDNSSGDTHAAESGASQASAPAGAAATPAAGEAVEGLTVQAGTGTERFLLPSVAVRITSCENDSELSTLTTGRDGTATYNAADGCYRAAVTTAPSGC
ncbi:hypothetical protein [Nocardia mexicana]|uniref:Uncharacterized protein n=1 Tax=Nocardia mexicana TaxID=279262 RepID=A0A370GRV4_9NOCA|nr:hypothetical protein [Nocardia mexicana]RDI46149.1 hypothetical protein DFR68_11250 [Nocardia mexicana]